MRLTPERLKIINVNAMNHLQRCRNAGQIAIRRPEKEDNNWFRIPNLGYQPFYDYKELSQEIERLEKRCAFLLILVIFGVMICLYVAYGGNLGDSLKWLACFTPLAAMLALDFEKLRAAQKQMQEYHQQIPQSLPSNASSPVEINWWSLVRQGYAPVRTRNYSGTDIGLVGSPWRILHNDSTNEKIPVVRINAEGLPLTIPVAAEYRDFLVACARIILDNELGPIRWGLVLDSSTFQCIAMPIRQSDLDNIPVLVRNTRDWFLQHPTLEFFKPRAGVCELCPFSTPRKTGGRMVIDGHTHEPYWYHIQNIIERMREEELLNVVREQRNDDDDDDYDYDDDDDDDDLDDDGLNHRNMATDVDFATWVARSPRPLDYYRSDCGDLFRWTPLHGRWIKKVAILRHRYWEWVTRPRR